MRNQVGRTNNNPRGSVLLAKQPPQELHTAWHEPLSTAQKVLVLLLSGTIGAQRTSLRGGGNK